MLIWRSRLVGRRVKAWWGVWLAVIALGGDPITPPLPPELPPAPPAKPRRLTERQLPTPPRVLLPTPPGGVPLAPSPTVIQPVPLFPSASPGLAIPTPVPGLVQIPPPGARLSTAPQVLAPPVQESVFAWDGLVKEYTTKPGEVSAQFAFGLTNTSQAEVTITSVRTSCGCTVAKLPSMPWRFAPGESGSFTVDADLRGKIGVLTKTVTVDSTAGYRYLTVRATIPTLPVTVGAPMSAADRARNMQAALADRQAVFRGDCVSCHLAPAVGKYGQTLYTAACGVCHEAEHRASMVPNLRALNKPQDREYWKRWITEGKDNTLMPAWGASKGGPLSELQIESLVNYLTHAFKQQVVRTDFPVE